ncbi:MAG: hypothetical protein KKE16_06355 [Firmicutes bacterium]|nr:hypothetical protein [Bacillota bacterium]
MKRFMFVLFGFYALLVSAYFLIRSNDSKYVTVITVKEELSRVVYRQEKFEVKLYSDQPSSFLFDIFQMEAVFIESDDFSLQIEMDEIVIEEDVVTYRQNEYSLVRLGIHFEQFLFHSGTEISTSNAMIHIIYTNLEEITFDIGNLHLIFMDEPCESMLYLKRLFGIVDRTSPYGGINGLLIELENHQNYRINFSEFDAMMDSVEIDNMQILELSSSEGIHSYEDIEELVIGEYNVLEINLDQDEKIILFLSFDFSSDPLYFNRFPIRIVSIQNGMTLVDYIDDFIYFSNQVTQLEVYEDELFITRYYYD